MAIKKKNLTGIIKVDLVATILLSIIYFFYSSKTIVILILVFNVILLGSYLIVDKNSVLIDTISQSKKVMNNLYKFVGENDGQVS